MTFLVPVYFTFGKLPSGQIVPWLKTVTDATLHVYWFYAPRGGKLFVRTFQMASGTQFWYSLGVFGYDATAGEVIPIQYYAETLTTDTTKTVTVEAISIPQALQWQCIGCSTTTTIKAFLGIEVYE